MFCASITNSIVEWHVKVHSGFVSLSSLAQDVIIRFAVASHVASARSVLAISGKARLFSEEKHVHPHHAH
jgi:hypothetical protein